MTIPRDFIYKNLFVAQHINIFDKFKKLFKQETPLRILEIGTYRGGLTLILRDILDELNMEKCIIRSYDIYNDDDRKIVYDYKNIDLRIENIFNDDWTDLRENDVKNFIQSEGITIILCDNGNKIKEFNILSKYLKIDDIIMAHDYSPDIEYFEKNIKNKIWDYCEIQEKDITEISKKCNLIPYLYNEFLEVVWICKKKTN